MLAQKLWHWRQKNFWLLQFALATVLLFWLEVLTQLQASYPLIQKLTMLS